MLKVSELFPFQKDIGDFRVGNLEKLHKLSFLGACRGAQPTLYSSCPSHEPSPRAGSLHSRAAERRYLYNLSPLRSFIASLLLSSPPESREEMLGFFLSFLFIFSNLKIEVELIYSVEFQCTAK